MHPRQLDTVGDADEADVPARAGGMDRLQHRLLGADRLDDGVRAEPVRELLDPLDASSPRSSTISVAPNSRARRCRDSWRLIAMTRSAPSRFAASTASSPTQRPDHELA